MPPRDHDTTTARSRFSCGRSQRAKLKGSYRWCSPSPSNAISSSPSIRAARPTGPGISGRRVRNFAEFFLLALFGRFFVLLDLVGMDSKSNQPFAFGTQALNSPSPTHDLI